MTDGKGDRVVIFHVLEITHSGWKGGEEFQLFRGAPKHHELRRMSSGVAC